MFPAHASPNKIAVLAGSYTFFAGAIQPIALRENKRLAHAQCRPETGGAPVASVNSHAHSVQRKRLGAIRALARRHAPWYVIGQSEDAG
jgi:hypothetical protein